MALPFYTLDVFTKRRYGGNPLAVVFGCEALSTAEMQSIAGEFNLSETVFVLPSSAESANPRLRIFTPAQELPFAGHPTIGAACLLSELGLTPQAAVVDIVLEQAVGRVPVRIRREQGRTLFAQLTTAVLPSFGPPPPPVAAIAAMLGLDREDIETQSDAPQAASCGVPYLLVPLKSRAALARVQLQRERWAEAMTGYWAGAAYVYCREPQAADAQLRACMFAPALGIGEDPATGSAAAALAGALARAQPISSGTQRWTIAQGDEMGRPSELFIEADKQDGRIIAIRVGGYAIRVSEGQLSTG